MRITFSRLAAVVLVGSGMANVATAHPGHSPADVAAQVSAPFAGADHFVAFMALTSLLLLGFRAVMKRRATRAPQPQKLSR